MTELYLIRHAQAEGNLYRMMQGHWNGDVTPLGLRQIEALGDRFRNVPLDAIYSSDLYRAKRTAEGLQKGHENLSIHYDRRLREIDQGPWTGRFFGDLLQEQTEEIRLFLHDGENWRIDGAETFARVRDRAFDCLEEIAASQDGKRVAVVSHGVTIRCILWKLLGIRLEDTKNLPICRNTAVTELVYENGSFRVGEINSTEHLAGIDVPEWKQIPDLRGESFDPASDPEYYCRCYEDAWKAAHGSLDGFNPMTYLGSAKKHFAADPNAVLRIFDGEESAGLIDLDTEKGKAENWGWISLLYLRGDYRHRGCGIQLLGRALMYYEKHGCSAVRLSVAEKNRSAFSFYRKYGFLRIGFTDNPQGRIYRMERKIGREEVGNDML